MLKCFVIIETMGKKILGIIGSYRKGGVIDTLVSNDDMKTILAQYKDADAIVFGAPVNFYNVNAVTRRFIERLVCL